MGYKNNREVRNINRNSGPDGPSGNKGCALILFAFAGGVTALVAGAKGWA